MDDSLLQRYSRHIMLDDFGIDGQQRLAAARLLLVGVGGLGCPAALYLAAAGVGELVLMDDDEVDLTNLQRQILHSSERLGMAKTDSAAQSLAAINLHCKITARRERLTADNADNAVAAADVVVDCTDNYAARHLLNRACVRAHKPLIFGAASGFSGQLAVFDRRQKDSPCYNCLFCETDEAAETRCALLGVLAPLAGIVGCLQAAAALKIIAMPQLPSDSGRLLLIEARTMQLREVRLPPRPGLRGVRRAVLNEHYRVVAKIPDSVKKHHPSGQHRSDGAGDEDHGHGAPVLGRSARHHQRPIASAGHQRGGCAGRRDHMRNSVGGAGRMHIMYSPIPRAAAMNRRLGLAPGAPAKPPRKY